MKDQQDLKLEALFRSETVNDDGFSDRVMKHIRRRDRVRRFALPAAVLVGGVVAAKPAVDLLLLASELVTVLPENLRTVPLDSIPHLTMVWSGIAIAGITAMCIRLLEQ